MKDRIDSWLESFSGRDWVLAGNIALQCRGKVLLFGTCDGVTPLVISAFGYDLYGVDDKDVISTALHGAYSLGLPAWYTTTDRLRAVPEGYFDTVVIGAPVSDERRSWAELEDACRFVSNNGRIVYLASYDMALSDLLPEGSLRTLFSIPQKGGICVHVVEKKESGGSTSGYSRSDWNIKDIFQPVLLEELDTTMRLTVIIPTFNRADLLPEALDSVLNQTWPNREIIVINDGSTDNTEQVLVPYMENIIYLRQVNGGVAAARNTGIRKASGRYVTMLDDDDLMLPRALELMARYIQRNPQTDVLLINVLKFKHEDTLRRIDHFTSFPYLEGDELLPWILHDWKGYGGTPLVRRDCFHTIGLFREDLRRSEDHEMHIRLVRHCRVHFFRMPLTMVRMHQGLRRTEDGYFHPNQSDEKGLEHGRLFFPDIYKTLSLEELVPSLKKSPGDVTLKARAYCERGLIAALYLFGEEAVSDLKQAQAFVKKNANISIPVTCFDKTLIIIKRLMDPKFKGSLKGVLKMMLILMRKLSNGREIRRYLSQRCYWQGLEFLKANKYHEGLAWLFYALRLLMGR